MGEKKKVSVLERFLHRVEVMGNKIPNPMLLFIYLCIAVIAISAVCSIFHVSAVNPVTGELVEVVNLFSKDGFVRMLTTFVTNFTGTSALGLTLTCMLGVGVAEASGLFHVALRGLAKAKGSDLKVIAIFCFVCVMADCTGGAGFVVMPPLGALIWAHGPQPHGRHVGSLCLCVRRVRLQPDDHIYGCGQHGIHRSGSKAFDPRHFPESLHELVFLRGLRGIPYFLLHLDHCQGRGAPHAAILEIM